jgi:hypothetical protein
MIGIDERDTKSGIHIFRVHYTANPSKRSEEWQNEAARGMPGGKKGRAWKREMCIDWTVATGIGVYSDEFTREWHVAKDTLEAYAGQMYRGWDLGPTHVFPACVVAQRDMMRLNVLSEIVSWSGRGEPKARDVGSFAEEVILRCNEEFPGVEWIDIADPASWQKQMVQTDAKSAIDILNRLGIFPRKGPVTFTARRDAMVDRLTSTSQGQPCILVDQCCKMIVEGLGGAYKYESFTDGRPKGVVEKNAWSHPMNALEYIVGGIFVPQNVNHDKDEEERRKRARRRRTRDKVTGY